MSPCDPHRPPPGAIPLERIADAVDAGRRQAVNGLVTIVLVSMTGCLLSIAPLAMVADGAPVWSTVLVMVSTLTVVMVGVWLGLGSYRTGRGRAAPGFRAAWLVRDRIDLVMGDGSTRTLWLHRSDLRLERPASGAMMAIDQLVLAGSGHDGRTVTIVLAHRRRKPLHPSFWQPEAVLAGIIAATRRSPSPAGRTVAAQLGRLRGDPHGWYRTRW